MTITAEQLQKDLPALLERVAGGEQLTITREGRKLARLVPVGPAEATRSLEEQARIEDAFARLRELRKGNRLGPELTIRQLIEEGRRF